MSKTSDFSGSGCYVVDEEFGLADYDNEYFSAPQVPTVSGCNLPDFVNSSVHYGQPNAVSPEKQISVNGDRVEESSANRKFNSAVNDRRKILSASTPVQKTFINRGIVADPVSYRNFCRFVEDKIKKQSASSEEKKTYVSRDTDEKSSAYRKFCSTEEDRRRILSGSTQVQKTFINRGIVADAASYRNFCRSVEDKLKKQRCSENSQSLGVKEFKDGSKRGGVLPEESSQNFMNRILKSPEYLHVQDNLKNPKNYRDLLYKQALKTQNKTILVDILPSITEESFNLDDVTDVKSCGELHVTEPPEVNSIDEHKPVINKMKQPKNRLKSFRNWLEKTFCCCCTTNQPP